MKTVNITSSIGSSRFNRFHLLVVSMCGLTILFDGYDLTIYGAALPPMIDEFGISPAVAGTIGSWALFGMMIGAMLFGFLSDRFGRKPIIVACVLLYSTFTGLVYFADTPTEVGVFRFVAGLGIGGVMPNAVALVAEYSPTRLRSTMVSIMFSGYMLGGIIAALISIGFIPAFGWRSIYLVGALPLLILVPILLRHLPESPQFMLRSDPERLAATMKRIDPSLPDGTLFVTGESASDSAPLPSLFRDGRAFGTSMLWVAFFMVLLMIYGLLTWLPELMIKAGYPLGSSLSFLLTLLAAGVVITWGGGYLSDRFGARRVLVLSYLIAALFVAVLGVLGDTALLWVYGAVALGGGATFAAQIFANAYAAQYYPARARSTGVGWALGVGRVGAIVGPVLGGILLTANVPLSVNFLAFAIPGIVAAITVALIRERVGTPVPASGEGAADEIEGAAGRAR